MEQYCLINIGIKNYKNIFFFKVRKITTTRLEIEYNDNGNVALFFFFLMFIFNFYLQPK
jgi:hypothetical protein